MSTDDQIEQDIKALGADVAPRITPADIEANIASEYYFTASHGANAAALDEYSQTGDAQPPIDKALDQVTFCVLVLRNGTKVVGVNEGPVSAANFNAEMGRSFARQKAIDQIWPMLGYELRSKLHKSAAKVACES